MRTGQLAVHGPGDTLRIAADARQDSRAPQLDVYGIGGRPIRELIARYGPFVTNIRAELLAALSLADVLPAGTAGQETRNTPSTPSTTITRTARSSPCSLWMVWSE
ncbi:hypothetical protein ACFHW1_23750 [Micromonospora sp. LOL_014]|uniref:hypothetical protein n=1 Tax=Micromonospora sp. LOL_014 TaxID=3345415 RepID=UPI003A8474B8